MKAAVTSRQDVLLAEAARRVKTYRGLSMTAVHDRPLVVLVTKYDAWKNLVGGTRLENPWREHSTSSISVLQVDALQRASAAIRRLLQTLVPQIVSTAESFVDPTRVIYLPVSATGGPPVADEHGNLRHRVRDLNPMWTEVPLLYVISQFFPGLIPFQKSAPASDDKERLK
jgi:hypothetical protein